MLKSCSKCGRVYPANGQCPVHPKQRSPSSRATRAPGWAALRRQILSRDRHRCWMCGGRADQVDHIVPVSLGGTNSPSNLRAACADCNKSRGARVSAPR